METRQSLYTVLIELTCNSARLRIKDIDDRRLIYLTNWPNIVLTNKFSLE